MNNFLTDLSDLSSTSSSRLGLQNMPTASLQRGKTHPNVFPGYDTKHSDGEAAVILEL